MREGAQVLLDRIRVQEDMGRLHQEQFRILCEMPDGFLQEGFEGDMVGIEHDDDFRR